jgi:hypothetical protein
MSTTAAGLSLTPSLVEGAEDRAIAVLQAYFTPVSGRSVGFTGGAFDTFDPSGTRSASPNTFTADDLVAVSLLSVDVPGRAALEILDRQRRRYEVLLEDVGPDRDLVEVESVSSDRFPPWKLWKALRELPGLGPTTVSKLMARKRPRLIPIFDSVIQTHLLHGGYTQWAPLHAALRADRNRLHGHLLTLRHQAGLDERITALRILDVLAWMDGRGWADKIIAGQRLPDLATAEDTRTGQTEPN